MREVFNYVSAMDHVLDPQRELPLSLRLLRDAHRILLSGVRGGYATPGEFRTTQNWIGSPGAVIDNATYVPPPPERIWECLSAFEKHLHADWELPPLLAIAALHYQFEAIHPFVDGNGRAGDSSPSCSSSNGVCCPADAGSLRLHRTPPRPLRRVAPPGVHPGRLARVVLLLP